MQIPFEPTCQCPLFFCPPFQKLVPFDPPVQLGLLAIKFSKVVSYDWDGKGHHQDPTDRTEYSCRHSESVCVFTGLGGMILVVLAVIIKIPYLIVLETFLCMAEFLGLPVCDKSPFIQAFFTDFRLTLRNCLNSRVFHSKSR